jgi:hypothetical protein
MKTTLLLFTAVACIQINAMDKSSKPEIEHYVAPNSEAVRNFNLMFGDHKPPFASPPWNPQVSIWHDDYKKLLDHAVEAIHVRLITLQNAYPTPSTSLTTACNELATLKKRLVTNYETALAKEESPETLARYPFITVNISIPTADIRDCAQWTDGGKKPSIVMTFTTGKVLMINDLGLANILLTLPRETRK